MIYYSKEAYEPNLLNEAILPVLNPKEQKKEKIATFYSIHFFKVNGKGDYYYDHRYPLLYKSRKEAIERSTKMADENLNGYFPLVCKYTIDRYRYCWIDYYSLNIKIKDGSNVICVKKIKSELLKKRGKTQ